MDTKKLIEEVLRIGTQVRVSEPKKGTPERIPFLTFCDSHGVANIKIMVLLQCAHNEYVILNFAGK